MAVLSAILKGQDNLSSVFEKIANTGMQVYETWQNASATVSEAFSNAADGANTAASEPQR